MGVVFLGNDPRLHRKVALKCLTPPPRAERTGVDDPRQLILREARAAARINHPNVATIHDVLEHEGRAFIVMEYVEGESLAARLMRERPSIERVMAIGRQLTAALAAAHAKGVVHRDLKPGNVHITPDGSVKVLDFGVAKAAAVAASTASTTMERDSNHQEAGRQPVALGTPGYMSPEQLLGRSVDQRSDIFSLGVILFEMTTGRRPFRSRDPLALVAALAEKAPRADVIDPTIPHELADVIARALEIDPDDRFESAAEVDAALANVAQVVTSRPVTAGTSLPAPAVKTSRRWLRVAIILLATPAALGTLGLLTSVAFNLTLGRTRRFGLEPPFEYFVLGLQSITAPLVLLAAVTIVVWAAGFGVRMARLFSPIDRALARWRGRLHFVGSGLGLDDPVVLAQAITLLGLAAIAVVGWRFSDLIEAWMSNISSAPPERLWPLRPANDGERSLYRITLGLLVLAFGLGLYRVLRLRARRGSRHGIAALSGVIAVFALLVLMAELPYRILYKNESERIDLDGTRCYVLGEDEAEWLIYCPDTDQPRNRVIRSDDPRVRRSGIVESIFTASDKARGGS